MAIPGSFDRLQPIIKPSKSVLNTVEDCVQMLEYARGRSRELRDAVAPEVLGIARAAVHDAGQDQLNELQIHYRYKEAQHQADLAAEAELRQRDRDERLFADSLERLRRMQELAGRYYQGTGGLSDQLIDCTLQATATKLIQGR